MEIEEFADYLVVVNDIEQYSIWPARRVLPTGWRPVGPRGSRSQCLSTIAGFWTDIRPFGVRKRVPRDSPRPASLADIPVLADTVSEATNADLGTSAALDLSTICSGTGTSSMTAITPVLVDDATIHLLGWWCPIVADRQSAILAACQYALARQSGQVDFTISCIAEARSRPMRCLVRPGSTFAELSAAAEQALGAPSDPADPAAGAASQTGCAPSQQEPHLPVGIVFSDPDGSCAGSGTGLVTGDLQLNCTATAMPVISVVHRTDRVDTATASCLARSIGWALRVGLTQPSRPLAELVAAACPASPPPAHRHRVGGGHGPVVPFPQVFAGVVARQPSAMAVYTLDGQLTYQELAEWAARIAGLLSRRGVGRGDVVALCLERSVAVVPAVLGTLACGAVYLPLDPALPLARIHFVLQDAGVDAFVGDPSLAADDSLAGTILISAHELANAPAEPTEILMVTPELDDLAYIVYTSGSTGRPKGVAIDHAALSHALRAFRAIPGSDSGDRFVAVTSLSFDISLVDLLVPVTSGGSLVLASRDQAADPQEIVNLAITAGGNFLQATPATWQMLAALDPPQWWPSRGCSSGETLSVPLARGVLDNVGEFWNLYGPSETTIWVTAHRVSYEDTISVPIGDALPGLRAYVLDPELNPSPTGVAGELYIGGACVGVGYLNRPGLTADRFVPDPFGSPGSRMYRTGDYCKRNADNRLQYIGRRDNQVTIRGHRIELDEITCRLLQHPDVRMATVVDVATAGGHRSLAAFVVPAGNAPLPDLSSWVAQTLPPYMVPAQITALDAFPLTPSGKIDRNALPDPRVMPNPLMARELSSETEIHLCSLWAQVLDVPQVSPTDDFFELGGDSLLALDLTVVCGRTFGVTIPLRALADAPTPARLSARIEKGEFQQITIVESDVPIF